MATLKVNVQVEGVRDLLRAMNRLPKQASDELRDSAQELARDLVPRAVSAAQGDRAPQSHLLAPTIRAGRDRVPVITVGGSRAVGSRRTPAYKLLMGSEFGSNRHAQFRRPHAGRQGYWFFSLVESESGTISRKWLEAADNVIGKFTG